MAAPVALPQTVNPGAALDFGVVFHASTDGLYSAVLRSEGVSSLLTVTVLGQLTLAQETATGPRVLTNGATIECGVAERGSAVTVKLLLQNQTAADQYLPPLSVQGDDFNLPVAPGARLLARLEETSVEIRFAPMATGARRGTLTFGSRSFVLSGAGLEAPLPRPRLSIALPQPQSGRQGMVTVLLNEVARTGGAGTLSVELRPTLPGAVDPAVQFATGGRMVPFTVSPGDDRAYFGDQPGAAFQTGTTAGTLVFTEQLGTTADQQAINLPPAPVAISAVQAARGGAGLEVRVTGFDNARTAGPLSFTFYDRAGTAIPPGAIRADSSTEFGRYFQISDAGGLFQLRASFPVTGDAQGIDAVEVEMQNSAGAAKSARTRLE